MARRSKFGPTRLDPNFDDPVGLGITDPNIVDRDFEAKKFIELFRSQSGLSRSRKYFTKSPFPISIDFALMKRIYLKFRFDYGWDDNKILDVFLACYGQGTVPSEQTFLNLETKWGQGSLSNPQKSRNNYVQNLYSSETKNSQTDYNDLSDDWN